MIIHVVSFFHFMFVLGFVSVSDSSYFCWVCFGCGKKITNICGISARLHLVSERCLLDGLFFFNYWIYLVFVEWVILALLPRSRV